MVTKEEIQQGRENIARVDNSLHTLGLINENGDLCKDGYRAVSHVHTLIVQIIKAIENDEGIEAIADELHKATNRIGDIPDK